MITMNIFDFIKSLDKDDLASLLYLIYYRGYVDGESFNDDISSKFNIELMESDEDRLYDLLGDIVNGVEI